MNVTLPVPVLDANGNDSRYTVCMDYDTAVAAGIRRLQAVKRGRYFYYKAEDGDVYRLTRWEIASCGAGQLDPRGIDFLLWQSYTGQTVKSLDEKMRRALSIPLDVEIIVIRPAPPVPPFVDSLQAEAPRPAVSRDFKLHLEKRAIEWQRNLREKIKAKKQKNPHK